MAAHQTEIDFQEQPETATDAIGAAALELLQAGRVHPHALVLAVTWVAGELGAGAALAGGMLVETMLDDVTRSCAMPGRTTPRRHER